MGNEEFAQVVIEQPIEVKVHQEPPFCQVEMLETAKAIKITEPNNHQEENFLKEIYNRNKNSVSLASQAPKEHHTHRGSL
jgi:sRNA-binding carbon storage regulator CsrA